MSDVAKIASGPECKRCDDTGLWVEYKTCSIGAMLSGGYCNCIAGILLRVRETPRLAVRAHLLENHDG